MAFKRDIEHMKRDRDRNLGWRGPVPDRYYYIVKNEKHPTMSAWIVRYTDNPQYEEHIIQIACNKGGAWSLIESDIPLPVDENCKLRRHSNVDTVRVKLVCSHDYRRSSGIINPVTGVDEVILILGTPVAEEEVFG